MREKNAKFLMIFLLIFLPVFLANCAKNSENFKRIYIGSGEKLIEIKVEIADDSNERENGLMFREKLNENAGMLFVFGEDALQTFWMKNTLIPLDMVFIDGNFEIVDIKHAVPCRAEPCALYRSAKPAKYVLEVNGNFTIKNNINIGDKIILNQRKSKDI